MKKLAAMSAFAEAIIYISAFIYFGAVWAYPFEGEPADKMVYLADNQFTISLVYFLIYVIFGVFLAVLVVGLYDKLKHTGNPAVAIGSVFGVVWVTLVIASGMLATIGLANAIELMSVSPEKAYALWKTLAVIIESIGGGNELVGGLWVLLISVAALQARVFSRGLNYLGIFVGIAGIATVYPDDIFTEIFGVSQIIWFIYLGVCLLQRKDDKS